MAKTNYQVTLNGKVVGIRKSDRIYTHAVVVQDNADAFYHWAHNETDRKNCAYDSKRAVQIVEQYLADWKYQKPDYVESQISEAKAMVEGGFEAYVERLRQEKIQMYEDRLAKSGTWSERLRMTDRRSLMKILAGATLLGVARRASAQKAESFTITYLALLPGEDRNFVPNFLRRLDQLGYVDGQNLHFVYRSAEGRPELLPGLASDLIRMKPDVLVTGFGTVAANAGKAAGDGIPVVFMAAGDPVGAGVVASLARPGGNVTGLSDLAAGLQSIRLELLREIVPAASLFAVVLNPGTPYAALAYKELEAAAHVAKVELRAFEVRSPEEIAPQLEASKAAGAGGLAIFEDPLTLSQRTEIAAVASRLRLPGIYGYREFAEAGGLMSYGTDHGGQWRRGAEIVDLILKGAKPADIPVEQPTKFELVVNLKTAKASNFTVPPTILIRADKIIE